MVRCCRVVVGLHIRKDDTATERRRKNIWVPIVHTVFWMCMAYFTHAMALGNMSLRRAWDIGLVFGLAIGAVGLLWPLITGRLTLHFIGCLCFLLTVSALVVDISLASEQSQLRTWMFVVLYMDLFLALDVPSTYHFFSLALVVFWIAATSIESAYRLGLFDIDDFSESSEAVLELCNCGNPPCAKGTATLLNPVAVFVVLVGDYYATRKFADGQRSEQAKTVAAIEVAEQVAASLAMFDLDAAREALDRAADGLPRKLAVSFRSQLHNLASYRPFLPQSCFERQMDGSEEAGVSRTGSRYNSHSAMLSGRGETPRSSQTSTGTPSPRGLPQAPSVAWAPSGLSMSHESSELPQAGGSVRRARQHSRSASANVSRESSRTPSSAGSSSSDQVHCGGMSRHISMHVPQQRKVTLLMRNSCGLLSALQMYTDAVSAWLAAEVALFAETVANLGGVSDLLSGDHLTASFGAVKVQGSQHASATTAAVQLAADTASEGLRALQRTVAVCTGRALCGDFGSATAQRFMVLGGVSPFAAAAERCAAAWRVPTLIDAAVHADVEQLWNCRLRKVVLFPKLTMRPITLWEVLNSRLGNAEAGEWMYELQSASENPWQGYSDAVRQWCDGVPAQALEEILAERIAVCRSADIREGLILVREQVRDGAQPPIADLSARLLAGAPSPLPTPAQELMRSSGKDAVQCS